MNEIMIYWLISLLICLGISMYMNFKLKKENMKLWELYKDIAEENEILLKENFIDLEEIKDCDCGCGKDIGVEASYCYDGETKVLKIYPDANTVNYKGVDIDE